MNRLIVGTLALVMVLAGSMAFGRERPQRPVSPEDGVIRSAVYQGEDAAPIELVSRRGYGIRHYRAPVYRYSPRPHYRQPSYRYYYHRPSYRPGYVPYYSPYPYRYRGYYPHGGYFYYGGPRVRIGVGF